MVEPRESIEDRLKAGKIKMSDDLNIWDWVHAFGCVLVLSSLFGLLGHLWWFFDLFSQFRITYTFFALVIGAAVLFSRRKAYFLGYLGVFIFNGWFLYPYFSGREGEQLKQEASYRALLLNVNSDTSDPEEVITFLKNQSPDIVALLEINDEWEKALESTHLVYQHRKYVPRNDNFGISLLSKFPIHSSRVDYLGRAQVPTITANLIVGSKIVHVIATHALPPSGAGNSRSRNEHIELLSGLTDVPVPVLLLGDLNIVPWNKRFKELLSASKLENSMQGWGIQTSWPSFSRVLGVPIDHILHSPEIRIQKREIGEYVGSDHLPVSVDFVLK